MLPQAFVAGPVEDFSPGSCRILEIGGRSVGVYHVEDEFFAVQNVCPHALAPICRGTLAGTFLPSDRGDWQYGMHNLVVRCPNHRWEFDIRTGESVMGVDRRRLLTFPVEVTDGQVVITMRPRPGSAAPGGGD
jgi:nitrite reductase (NADH) small subunit